MEIYPEEKKSAGLQAHPDKDAGVWTAEGDAELKEIQERSEKLWEDKHRNI